MKQMLENEFNNIFGFTPSRFYFAPGRVNLIGEHTDYNGGHVFPCALTMGTYAAVSDRTDNLFHFYSLNFKEDGIITTDLDDIFKGKKSNWANYPKGVIKTFAERGFNMPHGLDILIYGDIPDGAGLSSSAALEVLTGIVLKDTFGFDGLTMIDIALIGQYAENNYVGTNCGIMDQFASAMGKKDNAIFLDTNSLTYSYAPVILKDAKIVITNSKVKHNLANGSGYNERRAQCTLALSELQKAINIKSLGELSEEDFEANKAAITDDICRMRAKHAVYENVRTLKAVDALKNGDIHLFGTLMNSSHLSLQNDYDVSCPEIDFIVSEAWKLPGVIGSRITGGGFGGCTVSIIENEYVDMYIEKIRSSYKEKFNIDADFYIADIGNGAGRI